MFLRGAEDDEGEVLDMLVQERRNKGSALGLLLAANLTKPVKRCVLTGLQRRGLLKAGIAAPGRSLGPVQPGHEGEWARVYGGLSGLWQLRAKCPGWMAEIMSAEPRSRFPGQARCSCFIVFGLQNPPCFAVDATPLLAHQRPTPP